VTPDVLDAMTAFMRERQCAELEFY
jgi:hypothetical protein